MHALTDTKVGGLEGIEISRLTVMLAIHGMELRGNRIIFEKNGNSAIRLIGLYVWSIKSYQVTRR